MCVHVRIHVCRRACCCFHCLWSDSCFSAPLKWLSFFSFFFFISFLPLFSYGRVYTADPYHALAPAASYGVGAVVSGIFFLVLFLISSMGNSSVQWVSGNKTSPRRTFLLREEVLSCSAGFPVVLCSYVCVYAQGNEPSCRRPVTTWSCTSSSTKEMVEDWPEMSGARTLLMYQLKCIKVICRAKISNGYRYKTPFIAIFINFKGSCCMLRSQF